MTDAAAYKLERSLSSSGPWTVVSSTIPSTSTSHTAAGLTCGLTYYFRVSARGDGSPYSTTFGTATSPVSRATDTCTVTAPAPTGFSADSSTATGVTLSWNTVTDAAAYKVERSDSSAGPWTEVSSTITSTSHDVTGLTCNTTYYLRVSARGDGSPYSTMFGDPTTDSVSRDTGACPTAPAPAGLEAAASNQTSVSLSWSAVTDAAAYKLERREGTTGSWTEVSSSITSTSHDVTGLTWRTYLLLQDQRQGRRLPLLHHLRLAVNWQRLNGDERLHGHRPGPDGPGGNCLHGDRCQPQLEHRNGRGRLQAGTERQLYRSLD